MTHELPSELWALKWPGQDGLYVPPADDDQTDCFMVWPTREQAEMGLIHQVAVYIDLEPGETPPEAVRVK